MTLGTDRGRRRPGVALDSGDPHSREASSLLYVVVHDLGRRRLHERPVLRDAVSRRSDGELHVLRRLDYQRAAGAGLVAYNVLMPIVPVKTTASYDAAWPWRSQNGIKDERGHYHQITNVFFYSPFRELPDHTWVRRRPQLPQRPGEGHGSGQHRILRPGGRTRQAPRRSQCAVGSAARPLAGVTALYFEFYAGHYFRDIPDGYLETLASGTNRIADPALHEYYDRLRDVIEGPTVLDAAVHEHVVPERWCGPSVRGPLRSRRPIALSVRAVERTVHHRRRRT